MIEKRQQIEPSKPSPKASSRPVSDAERAGADLCKRIAAGFGVADHEKFALFCAEVVRACKGFSPAEIAEAGNELMRSAQRPNIGNVYLALAAEGRRRELLDRGSRPVLPAPPRKRITPDEIESVRRKHGYAP